jgi:hypothetical protein
MPGAPRHSDRFLVCPAPASWWLATTNDPEPSYYGFRARKLGNPGAELARKS